MKAVFLKMMAVCGLGMFIFAGTAGAESVKPGVKTGIPAEAGCRNAEVTCALALKEIDSLEKLRNDMMALLRENVVLRNSLRKELLSLERARSEMKIEKTELLRFEKRLEVLEKEISEMKKEVKQFGKKLKQVSVKCGKALKESYFLGSVYRRIKKDIAACSCEAKKEVLELKLGLEKLNEKLNALRLRVKKLEAVKPEAAEK